METVRSLSLNVNYQLPLAVGPRVMERDLSFSTSLPSQSAGRGVLRPHLLSRGQALSATASSNSVSGSWLVVSIRGTQIRNTLISSLHILPLDFNVNTTDSFVPERQEDKL